MANVGQLLDTCLSSNVVDLSWEVVSGHFVEAEIEKSRMLRWRKVAVPSAVAVASAIAEPNIVSLSNKLKCGRLVTI